jgi:hypothetical protein
MLALFSQAAKHENGPCRASEELIETRVGNDGTVFSKYISIGDDMWATFGTIHYAVEEEHEGDEHDEGGWTEPGIHLQEVRSPSDESTSVSQER